MSDFDKNYMEVFMSFLFRLFLAFLISSISIFANANSRPPTNLTVNFIEAQNLIRYDWTKSIGSDDYFETGYRIDNGSWVVGSVSVEYKNYTAANGQTWDFRVRTCEEDGDDYACGNYIYLNGTEVSFAPNVPETPTPPRAVSTSDTGYFRVSWSSELETTYYILQRQVDGGVWGDIFSGTVLFKDQEELENGTYRYRLKACNQEGCSSPSTEKPVIVSKPSPSAPGNLSASINKSTERLALSWTKSISSDDHFEVRSRVDNGAWIVNTIGANSYFYDITHGQNWDFEVRHCVDLDVTYACGEYAILLDGIIDLRPDQTSINLPGHNNSANYAVNWTEADGAEIYKLDRKLGGAEWQQIYSGSDNQYSEIELEAGEYQYRVQTCNSYGCIISDTIEFVLVLDSDQDGYSDLLELAAGMDSNNPNDSPKYQYHFLDNIAQTPSVYALESYTHVQVNRRDITHFGAFSRVDLGRLNQGDVLYSDGPLAIGSNVDGTDMPVPVEFAGSNFILPRMRNTHYIFVKNINRAAIEIVFDNGSTTNTHTINPDQILTISSSNNAEAATLWVPSGESILVSHRSGSGDSYPVPPAALNVYGINSGGQIGIGENNTQVNILASNGQKTAASYQKGYQGTLTGNTGSDGTGSFMRLSADKPITGIQYADSDGGEQTGYWPLSMFASDFVIPVNAQYAAIGCVTPADIKVYVNGQQTDSTTCNGSLTQPGKAYLGSATNETAVQIPQGARIEIEPAGYLIYETFTTDDEHNLVGYGDNDHDGQSNFHDQDDDNDGVPDIIEESLGFNPYNAQSKPHQYHFLNERAQTPAVYVIDGNTSVYHGENFYRNLPADALIEVGVVNQGGVIYSSKPLAIGSNTDGTDMPVPIEFAGSHYVIPQVRDTHYLFVKNVSESELTVSLDNGATTSTHNLQPGQIRRLSSTLNTKAATLEVLGQGQILVSHMSSAGGDAYAVPPSANQVYGIRSGAYYGVAESNTTLTMSASNGSKVTDVRNAHYYGATAGVSAADGEGSFIKLSADKPIAAIQVADSDGYEATAFWPLSMFATDYVIPVNAQYLAIGCVSETNIDINIVGQPLSTQTCNGSAALPGKAFVGSASNETVVQIPAGSRISSDQPVYLIYETFATDDEHNLVGIADTDGDGVLNQFDDDIDGDGYLDENDDLPFDHGEWVDTDGDGIGNNADIDDDNDGVDDTEDAFPLDDTQSIAFPVAIDPTNSAIGGSQYLGAIEGNHAVQADGSFSYTISIDVPPGINGMQPNLSLSYNSNRRNGIVGWGWALQGLGEVSRCNASLINEGFIAGINPIDKSQYADEKFSYCKDGQPLIEESEGKYGTRKETYVDIVYESTGHWTATSIEGTRYYYGQADSSRLEDSTSEPYRWFLDKVEDIAGNYYEISYETTNSGMHRISSIEYTKNDTVTGTNHQIQFDYESRTDVADIFSAGSKQIVDERLSKLTISTENVRIREYQLTYQQQGTSYDGLVNNDPIGTSKIDSIDLCYETDLECAESLQFGWSNTELDIVSDTAATLAENAALLYGGYQYSEDAETERTRFSASPRTSAWGYFDDDLEIDWMVFHSLENGSSVFSSQADRTGDGLIYNESTFLPGDDPEECETIVTQWDEHGFGGSFGESELTSCGHRYTIPPRVIDLNGDQKQDLLVFPNFTHLGVIAYLSNGDSFTQDSSYSFGRNSNVLSDVATVDVSNGGVTARFRGQIGYRLEFLDLNGDELIDVLKVPPLRPSWASMSNYPAEMNKIEVALNTGDGFGDFSNWMNASSLPDIYTPFTLGDVNGDLLPDIVTASGAVAINRGSSFEAATAWRIYSADYGTQTNYNGNEANKKFVVKLPQIADVNGDGLGDFIYIQNGELPRRGEFEDYVSIDDCLGLRNDDPDPEECLTVYIEVALSNGEGFESLEPVMEFRYDDHSNAIYIDNDPVLKDLNGDNALDIVWQSRTFVIPLAGDQIRNSESALTVAYANRRGGFTEPEAIHTASCLGSIFSNNLFSAAGFLNPADRYRVPDPEILDFGPYFTCGEDEPPRYIFNPYRPQMTSIRGSKHTEIEYELFNPYDNSGPFVPEAERTQIYSHAEITDANSLLTNGTGIKVSPNFGQTGRPSAGTFNSLVNKRNQLSQYGVASIDVTEKSQTIEQHFRYYGARYALGSYGDLGFEKIERYSEIQGTGDDSEFLKTSTYLSQEISTVEPKYALTGEVIRETTEAVTSLTDDSPILISDRQTYWKVRDYGDTGAHFSAYPAAELKTEYEPSFQTLPVATSYTKLGVSSIERSCTVPTAIGIGDRVTTTDDHLHSSGVEKSRLTAVCDAYGVSGKLHTNSNFTSKDSNRVRGLVQDEAIQFWDSSETGTILQRYQYGFNEKGQLATAVREPAVDGIVTFDKTLTTTYNYNDYGNYLNVTHTWQNDEANNVTHGLGDAVSRTRSYVETYSNSVRQVIATNYLGQVSTIEYDPVFGLESSRLGVDQLETTTSYDELGWPDTITHADGTTTSYVNNYCESCVFSLSYNSNAHWYRQMKRTGQSAIIDYFDIGSRELGTVSVGLTGGLNYQVNSYDKFGRVTASSLPFRSTVTDVPYIYTEYDKFGRLDSKIYPDGMSMSLANSAAGEISYATRKLEITDSLEHTYQSFFDGKNRRRAAIDALGTEISYGYNGLDRLIQTSIQETLDGEDVGSAIESSVGYDNLGRKISLSDPNFGEITFKYNALDLLYHKEDALLQVTSYGYDLYWVVKRLSQAQGNLLRGIMMMLVGI